VDLLGDRVKHDHAVSDVVSFHAGHFGWEVIVLCSHERQVYGRSNQASAAMNQHQNQFIEIPIDDPDRPFPFSVFVAIASYCRHHGPCTVRVASLPYGMWWQQLRPNINLVVGSFDSPVDDLTELLNGVWKAPGEWVPPEDSGYETAVAPYRVASWLDSQVEV